MEDFDGPALPRPREPLIGRERDLARLTELVGGDARLVTIVGPGGVGKTSLALQFAGAATRARFVDLSAAREEDDVARAFAAALACPVAPATEGRWRAVAASVAAQGEVLVVVDNAETATEIVVTASTAILDHAPNARLLVTSRARLRVAREYVLEIAPLDGAHAVQLFRDRMNRVGRRAQVDEAADIEALTNQLDRLPLAIEIAAARTNLLPPAALLAHLRASPATIAATPLRDVPDRHTTLRRVFDTSWHHLDQIDRTALRRVAIFESSFDLASAEAVVGERARTIDALQGLRDKSLIRMLDERGPTFGLLSTVRPFAFERLREAGELAEVACMHARHVVERGLAARARTRSREAREALSSLAALRSDLLAVVRRVDENVIAEPTLATGALVAIFPLDDVCASLDVVVARLRRALARGEPPPTLHAQALEALGSSLAHLGRIPEARSTLAHAMEIADVAGDYECQSLCLRWIAGLACIGGEFTTARADAERAAEIAAHHGHRWADAHAHTMVGSIALAMGDVHGAIRHFEEAIRIGREAGNEETEMVANRELALLLAPAGCLGEVRAAAARCAELARDTPDGRLRAAEPDAVACVHHAEGNFEAAADAVERAMQILMQYGDRAALSNLRILGAYRWLLGDPDRARVHFRSVLEGPMHHGTTLARLWLAAMNAVEGEAQGHTETFDELRDACMSSQSARSIFEALRAFSWIHSAPDAARQARARVEEDRQSSLELDLALRVLDERLRDALALVVDREGRWIRTPRGECFDVAQRPWRRLLVLLVERRLASPGDVVARDRLVEVAWPGERIVPSAAKNRLFAALSTLRRLGLGDALRTAEVGYFLDPAVAVRFGRPAEDTQK